MAALTEEQSILKDQAHAWVTDQAPVQAFRDMRDAGTPNGFAPDTWAGMVQMGWPGILIPESLGGSELGYLTLGIVLEETGRQLTASPLYATALVGASALLLAGSELQQQAWLPNIANGNAILTLAVDEGPKHAPDNIALRAEQSAGKFNLSGTKHFVLEGAAASALVVAARTSGLPGDNTGVTLFLIPANTPGITRQTLRTADSRGYANIDFSTVEVDAGAVLGEVGNGALVLEALLDRARAGLAAEMLGTAAQAFDMTLDYLKTRVQFGEVIGSFQALGHRAAGLFSEMELARSCVEAALLAIDNNANDVSELCSLSKCRVGAFLHNMSNELIQIHGGIGMTDEFDAGFYLKRARALETTYGNRAFHRNRYATLTGF